MMPKSRVRRKAKMRAMPRTQGTTVDSQSERVTEWREAQRRERMGHHGVNAYKCEVCHKVTATIDVDPGVTPMFLQCRRTPGCTGTAVSAGYPDADPPAEILAQLKWEWAIPTERQYRKLAPSMRDHVDQGGLILQPYSGRPSAYAWPEVQGYSITQVIVDEAQGLS